MHWLLCPSYGQEMLSLGHTLVFPLLWREWEAVAGHGNVALGTAAVHPWVWEFKLTYLQTSLTFPCSAVKRCSLSYSLILQAVAFFCLYQFGP